LVLQQYSVGENLKFQYAREEAAKTLVYHILQRIAVFVNSDECFIHQW
ncbi:hypothetical protein T4B_7055, partial [Trichinella pseudospiralis]